MEFVPREKAQAIREPSTANLLIDSIDRFAGAYGGGLAQPSSNFTITSRNSLMNGFFTRMAVSEIVLDWGVPNVSADGGNNTLTLVLNGTQVVTATLPDGFYTAKQAVDALVIFLNVSAGSAIFSAVPFANGNGVSLQSSGLNTYSVDSGGLAEQLGLLIAGAPADSLPIRTPAIFATTYVDFASDQLTYNQALKDDTTNEVSRSVLYRWVFAWDGQPPLDGYGYPIYQGYQPFRARRYFAFPKQIKWESNMPIGQLSFQVYSSDGQILNTQFPNWQMEWSMCLLVSEV